MYLPTFIVAFMALCISLSFGNPIEMQDLIVRGTDVALNVTTTGAANTALEPICNVWGGKGASVHRIEQGIDYLKSLHYGCHVPARGCARVSCSWDSAIFLCNERYYDQSIWCPSVADFAKMIIGKCSWSHWTWVNGQQFDTDGYNVIVNQDVC